METMEWEQIKKENPQKYLTESEYKIYMSALTDFNERLQHTKPKNIKKFAESGLGLSAWRYAHQFADPHKQPNLYKTIYSLVFNYQYER